MENLKLSKSQIKELSVVYYKKENFKSFDVEWVFYEKNICQFSTSFIRKKTYIGTWSVKEDSLVADFFYKNKNAPQRKVMHIKSVKKGNEIKR